MKNKVDERAGIFFHAFADTFDTLYEKQRNPLMRAVDYVFRSDIEIRYNWTFDAFGELNGKSIIDIGCGSGIYMKRALENNIHFICGLDPAENMLSLSKSRLKPFDNERYDFKKGTFPDYKLNQKFDYAIVMGVMDYVEDPSTFLKSLYNDISIKAVLSFPSYHWFRSPIRKFRYNLRDCPIWLYKEKEIKSLMDSVGIRNYEINKISGSGMDYFVTIVK